MHFFDYLNRGIREQAKLVVRLQQSSHEQLMASDLETLLVGANMLRLCQRASLNRMCKYSASVEE